MVRKRNGKSEKTEKRKFKTADKISYFGQRRHLCSTKKLQNIKSTRFSRSCVFLLPYLVVRVLRGIFDFRSCIYFAALKIDDGRNVKVISFEELLLRQGVRVG